MAIVLSGDMVILEFGGLAIPSTRMYVTGYDEIIGRIGGRKILTTTRPSQDEVDAWIDQAESELLGTLASSGIPTVYAAGSHGFNMIRSWVCQYVAALVRFANAAAGGDGSNDDGEFQVQEWKDRIVDIRKNPETYGAMLDPSGAAPRSSRMARAHNTSVYGTTDRIEPTFKKGVENF